MQDMQALRLQCIDDIEQRDNPVLLHNTHTTITTGEPQCDLLKTQGMHVPESPKCSLLNLA